MMLYSWDLIRCGYRESVFGWQGIHSSSHGYSGRSAKNEDRKGRLTLQLDIITRLLTPSPLHLPQPVGPSSW